MRALSLFGESICFFPFATKYNEPLAAVNLDGDDDRYDIVGCGAALAGPHWTSQISYEAVASVVRELSLFEALMCLFSIAAEYNEPLAGVNRDSDDDRYDIVGCGAAG